MCRQNFYKQNHPHVPYLGCVQKATFLPLLFKDCTNIFLLLRYLLCFMYDEFLLVHGLSVNKVFSPLSVAANQGLATLAFFGVGVNLVLFLTRVLGQDNANAANNVSKWTGTVYLCSLAGAFLSDSYWGRYLTCAIFQLIFVSVSFCLCSYFPFGEAMC